MQADGKFLPYVFHVLRFASDETYNACEYAHQKQEHESLQVIIVINCTECLAVLGYTVKIPVIRSIYQTINAEKSADWGKDHTGDIFQNIEDYFTRLIFKDSGCHFFIEFFCPVFAGFFTEKRSHLVHDIVIMSVKFPGIILCYQRFDLIREIVVILSHIGPYYPVQKDKTECGRDSVINSRVLGGLVDSSSSTGRNNYCSKDKRDTSAEKS